MKGIYTILLKPTDNSTIQVGKLSEIRFDGFLYVYVGSARGSGGLKRILRHVEVSEGVRDTQKWHIDYLLKRSDFLDYIYAITNKDKECELAGELSRFFDGISGFGCTDCKCGTHLFELNNIYEIDKICETFKKVGLDPRTEDISNLF